MMHAVASLPHSIASWLITTFGRRFAIYYAILALPTSCDGEFIRVLVNLGAIVPRYLVQALTSVFGKHLGRRRSSEDIFSLGVLDNLFYDAAQRLPFTGFAAIAYIASERYGNIQTSTPHGDLGTFLNHYLPTSAATDKDNNGDVGQTLLDQFGFMPAPLVTTPNEPPPSSLRVLLRLATTDPKTYQIIEPVFRFDPLARRYLWDVVLLFLFDLGFRATVDRPEDHASLNALKTVIRPTTSLVTSVEDQDLFCYAFVSLLRKYPVGYCDKQTMNRMLNLLKEHVYPGFSLKEALQSLTRREIRTDTKPLLEFQKQILTEIVAEDALLILAQGLGLFKLLCLFLQLHCKDNHLVLVLNTTQTQNAAIRERLAASGVDPEHSMQVIEYATSAESRSVMYRQGGVFAITSRILAVDMLLKRVPVPLISGVVVFNAHRIKPNSMEHLILQIYREENQEGFIKAFSDQPDAFSSGFAPLQNTLKSLQLRKVHLWPRFQVLVSDNLAHTSDDVVELRQPMTSSMDKIQQSLVECLETTLAEVRRLNSTVDAQDFTVENSLFKSFDTIIRRQLDPVWHRVSPATKQFVNDLHVLRNLLEYLMNYDCVSFYSFIEAILASNTGMEGKQVRQSQWLFLSAADMAISTARKRVYLRKSDPGYDISKASAHIPDVNMVLEEQPKWNLLKDILHEIEQDIETTLDGHATPVLIMVKDKRTLSQLKEYISHMDQLEDEPSPVLNRLAQNFFLWQDKVNTVKNSIVSVEARQQQNSARPQRGFSGRNAAPPNKRRRVRGSSVSAAASASRSTLREDVQEVVTMLDAPTGDNVQDVEFKALEPDTDQIVSTITMGENDILPEFDEIPRGSLVTIQCYESVTDEQVLEDTQPLFIIMYDPDPAFVRRIEVYRAMNPNLKVRVYFMIYDNSVEEQTYLSLIRKEKEAFERLIREKSIMAIPLPQQKPNAQEEAFSRAVSSRIAGGQLQITGPPLVIVDMREFRSSLPPILYSEGIKVVPCTLQVGDYILSPDMCVERKSIADLISSFTSGRLYTQCESMTMYYKTPILLIEFEENKSFSLQSLSDMKDNIATTDISTKLVLLTLSFPKLRIIWSSSPHETAAIFTELKKTQEQPDLQKAAMMGTENPEDVENTYNMTPQEILRSMPGVTSKNYQHIMNAVDTIEELCSLTEEAIQKIIGKQAGQKLYRFIHRQVSENLTAV
ncbi:hypothetical protein DFQ29_002965 [Apophysomyces sp. BC1021]|nr:hypothetical protein DFQ29_002965 [Apophysomyces sp. BC1021]